MRDLKEPASGTFTMASPIQGCFYHAKKERELTNCSETDERKQKSECERERKEKFGCS